MRLFRPWDSSRFLAALPKTTERICVLDRTKEQGSQGEPLLLEVASMLHASAHSEMVVIGGGHKTGAKVWGIWLSYAFLLFWIRFVDQFIHENWRLKESLDL